MCRNCLLYSKGYAGPVHRGANARGAIGGDEWSRNRDFEPASVLAELPSIGSGVTGPTPAQAIMCQSALNSFQGTASNIFQLVSMVSVAVCGV